VKVCEDERVSQVALNLRLWKKTCDGRSAGLARPPKMIKAKKGVHAMEGSWKSCRWHMGALRWSLTESQVQAHEACTDLGGGRDDRRVVAKVANRR
jgi:hypothetical protein